LLVKKALKCALLNIELLNSHRQIEDEKLEGPNSTHERHVYSLYIHAPAALQEKKKNPFSIVWYDEMFVQKFRRETKV
jgi:hypothetical protein